MSTEGVTGEPRVTQLSPWELQQQMSPVCSPPSMFWVGSWGQSIL